MLTHSAPFSYTPLLPKTVPLWPCQKSCVYTQPRVHVCVHTQPTCTCSSQQSSTCGFQPWQRQLLYLAVGRSYRPRKVPREEFPLAVPRMPTHWLGREQSSHGTAHAHQPRVLPRRARFPSSIRNRLIRQAASQETTLPVAICHRNSFAPHSAAPQWALQSGWSTPRSAPGAQPCMSWLLLEAGAALPGAFSEVWAKNTRDLVHPLPHQVPPLWGHPVPGHGTTTSPSPNSTIPDALRCPAGRRSCFWWARTKSGASSCPQHTKTPPQRHPARCRCQHVDKRTRAGMRPPKYTPYIIPQPVGVRGMWLILHDMFWTFRSERLSAPADLLAMDVIWPADFTTNEHQSNTQWHCSAHQLSASFPARPRDKFAKCITRILFSSVSFFSVCLFV